MNRTSPTSLAATLDTRRDMFGLVFVLAAIAAAWLPLPAFGAIGVAELGAIFLTMPHARRLDSAQRSPISMLGHITAVISGALICVFFMARYVHYIGFQTHIVPTILLALALVFLLALRRPVH